MEASAQEKVKAAAEAEAKVQVEAMGHAGLIGLVKNAIVLVVRRQVGSLLGSHYEKDKATYREFCSLVCKELRTKFTDDNRRLQREISLVMCIAKLQREEVSIRQLEQVLHRFIGHEWRDFIETSSRTQEDMHNTARQHEQRQTEERREIERVANEQRQQQEKKEALRLQEEEFLKQQEESKQKSNEELARRSEETRLLQEKHVKTEQRHAARALAAEEAHTAKVAKLLAQLDALNKQKQSAKLQQPGSPTTSDHDRILMKEIQRIKELIEEEVLMKCAICTEVLVKHDEYKMPHTTKCQVCCAEHACWVECSHFALC